MNDQQNLYITNKLVYDALHDSCFQSGGNDKSPINCVDHNWDSVNIIDKLGSGYYGTTYKVSINDHNTYYALKRQGISKEVYDTSLSSLYQVNIEIKFYDWISKLDSNDRKFFMQMYCYRRFECTFDSNASIIKNNSNKFCQDTLLELKGISLTQKINKLNNHQFLSIFCQIIYALSLMHNSKYHHRDIKSGNICILSIPDKRIKIGYKKINSYGVHASLIDYGTVVREDLYPLDISKGTIDIQKYIDIDLWGAIDSILLNNTFIYIQIDRSRTCILPNEVFEIIKGVYNVSPKIYMKIYANLSESGYQLDDTSIINNAGHYNDIKKNHMIKAILYEFLQRLQIYYPEEFTSAINAYFEKHIILSNIIDYELIKRVVECNSNMYEIINIINNVL